MAKKNVRLMNTPADYERWGVNPNQVEAWEDGKRSKTAPNSWEWWYFDAIMDDGSSVVIQFLAKPAEQVRSKVDVPAINFQITTPDGVHHGAKPLYDLAKSSFGTESCDVHYEGSYFVGDLKNYDIHVEPVDGMAATLHVKSLSTPFRPGTAYFDFGGGDYYTWFCAMPKGEVSGTIMVDGEEREVHGFGYHDHQWGNFVYLLGWNHWTWARQRFEDYTLVLFDKTASRDHNHTHMPLCYLEDKDGNLLFSNTDDSTCTVETLDEYTDEATGKPYPAKQRFTFEHDGKKLVYTLTETQIIEAPDTSKILAAPLRHILSMKGFAPSYARYMAEGEMVFTNTATGETVERKEPLIYEFMYPGKTYKI